jgi:hypothetical protein
MTFSLRLLSLERSKITHHEIPKRLTQSGVFVSPQTDCRGILSASREGSLFIETYGRRLAMTWTPQAQASDRYH